MSVCPSVCSLSKFHEISSFWPIWETFLANHVGCNLSFLGADGADATKEGRCRCAGWRGSGRWRRMIRLKSSSLSRGRGRESSSLDEWRSRTPTIERPDRQTTGGEDGRSAKPSPGSWKSAIFLGNGVKNKQALGEYVEREGHEGMKAPYRGSMNLQYILYLRLPQLDIDDQLPQEALMLKRISNVSKGKRP